MINDNATTGLEDLFTKLRDYAETRIDLIKLMAISKVSGLISTVVSMMMLILLLFLAIICLTIGIAILIGHLLGAAYWGFFIITILYVIIGLVVYAKRGSILKNPISDKLIKEMMD
jgi:F0F1-type ATP synthase assembly protein I